MVQLCRVKNSIIQWLMVKRSVAIYAHVTLRGHEGIQLKCIPEKSDTTECIPELMHIIGTYTFDLHQSH